MKNMSKTKEKWDDEDEDEDEDEQDRVLSQAIELAIQQGRGWGPGEKEAYLEKILADDFIPPLFATSQEELEKSGLQDAFTSLIYDGESPTRLMLQFRKKGNEAFANGKRNETGNVQYYRDAINHYQEALSWALKIEPMQLGDLAQADTDDPTYTERELDQERATIASNIALMHLQLKNWGHASKEAKRALQFDSQNVKAWYRLAKSSEMLKHYDDAGDAIDSGLAVDANNHELKKLQQTLSQKIRQARQLRQQRASARAERVAKVKAVWKHCNPKQQQQQENNKNSMIKLARTALVATVTDDDDEGEGNGDERESRWHQHLPISGVLPQQQQSASMDDEWTWPCLFLYPSHKQSDFIKDFGESELLAARMAELFPELEEDDGAQDSENEQKKLLETNVPWDVNNEFTCSNLAVYFEVHQVSDDDAIHPDDGVELLRDQASCMRFYESSRALKGDEGPEMAEVVRAVERKHLYRQRQIYKKKHGSLWHRPDPCPVVRVHPAVQLSHVLRDPRMVVPNFIVTFLLFPENHPTHQAFLKEHKCLGILQPKDSASQ